MHHEIGGRHVAGKDERCRPCEGPDKQQNAADNLDRTLDPQKGRHRRCSRRKAEVFLQARFDKQKRRDDSDDAEHRRRPFSQ